MIGRVWEHDPLGRGESRCHVLSRVPASPQALEWQVTGFKGFLEHCPHPVR